MASSKSQLLGFVTVLLVLILLPLFAKGDVIPPVLSPYLDKVCRHVECGKGHCKSASGYPFGFKCECEVSWKRTRLQDEDHLQFLPCIIPNCSMDYSCMPAAPPAPAPAIPFNLSFFDPCYWIYCGEGSCTKNSTYRHSCACNPGHQNLLNATAFPCYSECAIGSNCATLGIRARRSSFIPGVTSTSSSTSSHENQATLLLPRKFQGITILLISLAMAIWK